ncbi:PepSY domain-containing protein [Lysinibacillus sp. FSL K6-0232]|uniref:PepSY-associated TM helix domain-containing protein n=1 Tax=unclassified Lysinibacillus TaxID=2636778 RepID=UPI0030FC4327
MKNLLYTRFWRLHFFAALFITPLLLSLTLSGIGYLFYTDVENQLYDDYFFGQSKGEEALTIDEAVEKAEAAFAGYSTRKVIMLEEPYNTRLTLSNGHDEKYVFLDDHNQRVGSQDANYTFSNIMRNIHSSLFIGGTFVNYLVELAACWTIFLLLSGLYMTFKGNHLKKHKAENKRQKNKRLHALVGTIITIPMVIFIFTGLLWSALLGSILSNIASDSYPALQQQPPTSEIAEIPWATRQLDAPASDGDAHALHHGGGATRYTNPNQITIAQLEQEIQAQHIEKPYTILYPANEEGVFTVAKASNSGVTGLDVKPSEEATMYFDQYSGNLIDQVNYEDYGLLAKVFTWGIPLHEGHLFGWPNKLLNLVVCLAFLAVIMWGIRTWILRKKKGELSAPPQISAKISRSFSVFLLFLGVIMPLFGISLIVVVLIECVLIWQRKRRALGS